eukprot:scaffold2428_cov24-Cyclotella_meneghiniana.AAC.1
MTSDRAACRPMRMVEVALSRMVGDGSKSMTVADDDDIIILVRCNDGNGDDARDGRRWEKALMDGSPLVVSMAMDVVVSLIKSDMQGCEEAAMFDDLKKSDATFGGEDIYLV